MIKDKIVELILQQVPGTSVCLTGPASDITFIMVNHSWICSANPKTIWYRTALPTMVESLNLNDPLSLQNMIKTLKEISTQIRSDPE